MRDWITSLTPEMKTITISSKDVITPEMWDYTALEIGTRESIFNVTEIDTMWNGWKAQREAEWERIYNALTIEYNPIENTDRYESTTDITTHSGTDIDTQQGTLARTGTDTLARTGTDTNASVLNTTVTASGNVTQRESAFNSYQNPTVDNINEETSENKTSGGDTNTLTRNLTDTTNHNTMDTTDMTNQRTLNLTDKFTHENHTHGNIGVTTNVAMLTEELNFRNRYILFNEIVRPFLDNVFY